MTEDGNRRPGDWQRRDQRKDANDLVTDPGAKPWYRQTFWIVVLLLVFWPVGVVLCWKSDWHVAVKVVATVVVLFLTFMGVQMRMSFSAAGY